MSESDGRGASELAFELWYSRFQSITVAEVQSYWDKDWKDYYSMRYPVREFYECWKASEFAANKEH